MANFRVYLKTYDSAGNYDADFTDITKYVQKIGKISIDTDSADYQIGVFRTSNVQITLNNRDGLFSDTGALETLFIYRRADSIIKITYQIQNDGPWCGAAEVDEDYLCEEVEVYRGLLDDQSLLENAKDEVVSLNCLGFESKFENVETNYASLSNGMLMSVAMYTILNQTDITQHLTISQANIVADLDQTIDDVSSFENTTVKEALDLLLNASNSIPKIIDQVFYVSSRDPGASVAYTFYGQSSQNGVENVMDISKISNGMNRTFNFATWKDTILAEADATSVSTHGTKKIEVDFEFVTNTTRRTNILDAIVADFGTPKQELELTTPLNYASLEIDILDRTSIDYPTVLIPWENFPFPVCGTAVCGSATTVLPRGLWALTIDPDTNYKVIKKELEPSKHTIKFKMREI